MRVKAATEEDGLIERLNSHSAGNAPATAVADPEVKSGKFAEQVDAFAAKVASAPLGKSTPGPATPSIDASPQGPVAVH